MMLAPYFVVFLALFFVFARNLILRSELISSGTTGALFRQWYLFQLPIFSPKKVEAFSKERVREVHLVQYSWLNTPVEKIFVLDEEGRRREVYQGYAAFGGAIPPHELSRVANRFADLVDAPVRTFSSFADDAPWSPLGRFMSAAKLLSKPALPAPQVPALSQGAERAEGKKAMSAVQRCLACGEILSWPVIECRSCKNVVHEACWEASRGCPVEACRGRQGLTPKSKEEAQSSFSLYARGGQVRRRHWALLALPFIFAFVVAFISLFITTFPYELMGSFMLVVPCVMIVLSLPLLQRATCRR